MGGYKQKERHRDNGGTGGFPGWSWSRAGNQKRPLKGVAVFTFIKHSFANWTGCSSTSGTDGSICSVRMISRKFVTANYLPHLPTDDFGVAGTYTIRIHGNYDSIQFPFGDKYVVDVSRRFLGRPEYQWLGHLFSERYAVDVWRRFLIWPGHRLLGCLRIAICRFYVFGPVCDLL